MLQAEGKHPLPPTVVDQIKLWELERNRLTYTEGVLYSQFLSQVIAQENKLGGGCVIVVFRRISTFSRNMLSPAGI